MDTESIREELGSLRSEIRGLLTRNELWQGAHEKLDEERWDGVKEKLSELKGMLETIPLKVGEDIRDLTAKVEKNEQRLEKNEHTIILLKGVWLAVSVGVPVLFALLELYLHGKG